MSRGMSDATRRGLSRAVLGLSLAGAIAGVAIYSQPPARDEQSLCLVPSDNSRRGGVESAHNILIVDKTDKWNTPQATRLRNLVLRARDDLAINERLSIFVFAHKVERGFEPTFSLCNPGRGSDKTIWTSNPRRWEKKFVEKFGSPLDVILNDLTQPTEGKTSPILEVLIDVASREEIIRFDIPRRIVFVSDMLQNTDAYTFFSKPVPAPIPPVSPKPKEGGVGGPFIPVPLPPPGTENLKKTTPAPRGKTQPGRPTSKEVVAIVERQGGLQHLRKFRIEVYQITGGKYSEQRLKEARDFWDLIASEYGVKIDWKTL